jgi:DNA-binding winged helix-turn-helix (wHTH) protein
MIWRVRDIELDDTRFELRRCGRRVAIAPKPLAVLLHLARRHPASVDRDELLKQLWPGVHVTASSLARAIRAARRAMGERADDTSTIRTVRGRGYALGVPPVTQAPTSDVATLPGGVPFIGRAAELAVIEKTLARAALGLGGVLLLGGEPGIGKSTLAAELLARARQRDMLAVTGTCRKDTGAPPWWPWPEVVDGVVRHHGEGILHALGPAALDLAPILPRLSDPPADLDVGRTADRHARFRLLATTATLLRRAASSTGLVVLLEDVHSAGIEAIHLLRFVGRAIAEFPLVVAVTFRTAGTTRNRALEAACGELSALPHAVPEMRLGGWAAEDISAYVSRMTGADEPADLARRLHRATDGNPLFVRALLSAPSAAEGAPDEWALPRSIEHVLRQQWCLLSRATRDVVESAAAIGRDGPLRLLGRVTGRNPEAILEAIDEARTQNLLMPEGDHRFRFTRDLAWLVIHRQLHPRRRAELRRRAAVAGDAAGSMPSLAVIGGRRELSGNGHGHRPGHRIVIER